MEDITISPEIKSSTIVEIVNDYLAIAYGDDISVDLTEHDLINIQANIADAVQLAVEDFIYWVIEKGGDPQDLGGLDS
jgi:hypothetical protein